jgi:tetratricopeptide (TPR) repeat protein
MTDRLEKLMAMREADPDDAFCAYAIAMEHAKAGRVEEAIGWLDETLRLDGSHAYACYQKARLLADVGRTEEAGAMIEAGLQIAESANDAKAAEELRELRAALPG